MLQTRANCGADVLHKKDAPAESLLPCLSAWSDKQGPSEKSKGRAVMAFGIVVLQLYWIE